MVTWMRPLVAWMAVMKMIGCMAEVLRSIKVAGMAWMGMAMGGMQCGGADAESGDEEMDGGDGMDGEGGLRCITVMLAEMAWRVA
eukprot:1585589-Rhodomonas_salina.4